MVHYTKIINKVQKALKLRGEESYQIARKIMLEEKFDYSPINEAVHYFMNEFGQNYYHPALLSLACELVGGKSKFTKLIGASLVLITGAADIHDDIIDKSKIKGSKLTVLGKYGEDISLLIGNALILKGCTFLYETCRALPKEKGTLIYNLVKHGFFKLIDAEAREAHLKGNWTLASDEYFHILEMKTALAEATAHIGAILGDAKTEEIKKLRKLAKILSLLNNIRNEFVDIYEKEELRNRVVNECLPLPIICAFSDLKIRRKMLPILARKEFSDDDIDRIMQIIDEAETTQKLKNKMEMLARIGTKILSSFKESKAKLLLHEMLQIMTEGL